MARINPNSRDSSSFESFVMLKSLDTRYPKMLKKSNGSIPGVWDSGPTQNIWSIYFTVTDTNTLVLYVKKGE